MLEKTVPLMALVTHVLALENGLLQTPPMGWLAWERFRCNIDCEEDPKNCISERLFVEMADRLAQDGWRDLGYTYLNIDDCWIGGRDDSGNLVPDPKRFPSGIAYLADYAHSLGLKLGIYADMGNFTCMGYPGTTLDRVVQDAQTFAKWKVDMLKLDGCYSTPLERAYGYPKMSAALNATGRPIAFSCSWPAYEGGLPPKVNYTLLANVCNLWRNYDDIQDSWKSVLSILHWFVENQDILQPVAGPGHWNDPDMVPAGRGVPWAHHPSWTCPHCPVFPSFLDARCQVLGQRFRSVSLNQLHPSHRGNRFPGPTPSFGLECSGGTWECPLLTVFPGESDVPWSLGMWSDVPWSLGMWSDVPWSLRTWSVVTLGGVVIPLWVKIMNIPHSGHSQGQNCPLPHQPS